MVTNSWTYECAYEGCGKRYYYHGSLINHLLVYHEDEELLTACSYDTAIWKYTYHERGYFERQKKDAPQGDKDKSAKPPEDEIPEVGDDDEFYEDIFEMGAEADDEEGVGKEEEEVTQEDASLEPADLDEQMEPENDPARPSPPAAYSKEGSIVPTVGIETTFAVDSQPACAKRRRTDGPTEAKLLLIPTVSENTAVCPFQGCDKPFVHFCNHFWAFHDYEIALPPLHLPGRPEDIEESEGENSGKVFSRPEGESRAQVE